MITTNVPRRWSEAIEEVFDLGLDCNCPAVGCQGTCTHSKLTEVELLLPELFEVLRWAITFAEGSADVDPSLDTTGFRDWIGRGKRLLEVERGAG
jgi:hypothetical protein